MALVVRTIGIARARVKIGLANLAYNIRRYVWLSRGEGAHTHMRRTRLFGRRT